MKRKRHTPEEIIRKLRDADAQLANGATVADVSKTLGSARIRSIAGVRSTVA